MRLFDIGVRGSSTRGYYAGLVAKGNFSTAAKRIGLTKAFAMVRQVAFTLTILLGLSSLGDAHSGIVDGYGCHRGADKVSYHCHQGQFTGRTFKSKEDFLRQLRGGKAEQLSPKNNPPQLEKKIEE
jgi:hypothetical protein